MMDSIFPTYRSGSQGAACNTTFQPVGGLPLRDIFAGLAMQGFIANTEFTSDTYDETAARAYTQADAMLKVRARKEQP